jgi:serine/threonine protein kinase
MTPCPDEDELVRMVEGALGDASLAKLEAHVDDCEKCAAVLAGLGALGSAAEPRRIGRYQLDRRIAAGGMGEVWAAWDPQLRRDIAVKLVRPDRADDGRERERLLREARALARLTHPNVLAVHDVGELDGEVFIATELVAGDTLASRSGPSTDWRVLAGLYAQAARGLAAAHAAGLVHRDVKPANLLLGSDGRVRVADFGLAVRSRTPAPPTSDSVEPSVNGEVLVTAAGHIVGTPAYMAPEQRAGAPADARVDQYALCVAFAEAIVGRRPSAQLEGRDALIAFVAERRPREPELDAMCGVIARGLAIDPEARFVDTNALAEAIEAIVSPREATPSPATIPSNSRGRRLAIAAVVAAVGVTAVVIATRTPSDTEAGNLATRDSARTLTTTTITSTPNTTPTIVGTHGTTPSTTDKQTPSATPNAGKQTATVAATIGTTGKQTPIGRTTGKQTPSATNSTTTGSAASTTGTTSSGSGSDPLVVASAAIERHDARSCRAVLATLPAKLLDPAEDLRAAQIRAQCEMIAGNCDGGVRMLTDRVPMPAAGAAAIADLYCPPGDEPVARLRRLSVQTTRRSVNRVDCAYYVAPARAARLAAHGDIDKVSVATVMTTLATCFSARKQCDEAHALAAEANELNPRIDADNELLPACRR